MFKKQIRSRIHPVVSPRDCVIIYVHTFYVRTRSAHAKRIVEKTVYYIITRVRRRGRTNRCMCVINRGGWPGVHHFCKRSAAAARFDRGDEFSRFPQRKPPPHRSPSPWPRVEMNSFSAQAAGLHLSPADPPASYHPPGHRFAAVAASGGDGGSSPPAPRRPMCQRLLFYVGVVVGGACSDPPRIVESSRIPRVCTSIRNNA